MTDKNQDNPDPVLDLNFISHGTLESQDLDVTRKFYEEYFGFECVRTSKESMWIRLGGKHIYVVVENRKAKSKMNFLNHNGLDVSTDAQVDESHKICVEQAEKWGLKNIKKPRVFHGTYCFYFWDADGNCWEILSNPKGGYSWMFDRGDQQGKGHHDQGFKRPDTNK